MTSQAPQRDTLHTVAYNDPKADQDESGQQITETFHLSNDSNNEYQNSNISDQTELDTETDTNENDNADSTRSITHHQSRAGEKQTNNRVSIGRISTISGSQEATIVWRNPPARAHIIQSSMYTQLTISTSGISSY